ncbi:MAG: signal recognition particle-docking protein FtsY [Rhodospirillales bacterium]
MSETGKTGWLARLKAGLSKTSDKISSGIGDLLAKRKLDDDTLRDLEEILIAADLGAPVAAKITGQLAAKRFGADAGEEEVRGTLAEDVAAILEPAAKPLTVNGAHRPHVILVCGVNGSGKTTTIGKLAKQFREQGKTVMLAAGDTFRAAAIEQLQVWGERADCPVVTSQLGADAAGLAFDALEWAKRETIDVVMIDTAGRLQNKKNLMDELEKIVRVIKKLDDTAPHDCLLVLDATVGQNAHAQVEVFRAAVNVTGLVLTKLDGSAKGGVVVALADKFGLPVHAVGVGEGIDDLKPFEARAIARHLMGLEA